MYLKQLNLWFWAVLLLQFSSLSYAAGFNFTVQKCRTSMPLDTARSWFYQGERPEPNLLNACLGIAAPGMQSREIHLLTLKSGTPLYHWGSVQSDKFLNSTSGIMNASSMDGLIRGGASFLQGGGFYVSTDMLDSSEYGPALGVVNLDNNTFFANYDELKAVIGDYLWNDLQIKISLREAGVAGTYSTTASPMSLTGSKRGLWLTITDNAAMKGYHSVTQADVYAEMARPDSTLRYHGFTTFSVNGKTYSLR